MNFFHSVKFFERAKKVTPGGVHSPARSFAAVGGTPIFIEKAQGVDLEDVDGNHYIDYCMSWGPLIFGHQDPEVGEAIQGALSRGWSFGTAESYSLELAELITKTLPWIQKIRFVNSGTEAVMSAIRLARAATGKRKILKFEGCYHGHSDSMLVKSGPGLAGAAHSGSAGVCPSAIEDTVIVPLDNFFTVQEIFNFYGNDVAAVIIEPIPANHGLLPHKQKFLLDLIALARGYKSLVIFDEVITGFRISWGGMAEYLGVSPDLVTYAKIIGGGLPVGAYGGRSDLMDLVSPIGGVYQAGTYSANPMAMKAGFATLTKLKREQPYTGLEKRVEDLVIQCERVAKEFNFPLVFQRVGSIFWPIFGKKDGEVIRNPLSIPTQHHKLYAKIFHFLLEEGIYLPPSPFEVSFLSTAHQDEHQERFVLGMRKAIERVCQSNIQ